VTVLSAQPVNANSSASHNGNCVIKRF